MKKNQQSNPVAVICAVTTLIIIDLAVRHCMRKYGRK